MLMIACPDCGANLRFDITEQQMKCDYCGCLYDPYQFDSMQEDASREKLFDAWVYSCPSCGAELLTTDQTDVTAFCQYCGGTSILFDRLRSVRYPTWIIPFQLDKEDCKRAYRKAARKAIFTPSRYKKEEYVESFRGIYMPYWSYSVEQKGNARVDAESRSRRDGDYLVTEQYVIQGDIDISYDGYAHDASRAFDDEISECLAPFDTENRQTFTPGFLSGFYVDVADEPSGKYLDDAKTYYENLTARKLLRNEEILQTAKSQHIHTTDVTGVSIPTKITGIEQVLYPVWFLSYRDGDRITYASVNGQTGKVVADFPISKARFLLASLIVSALVFLLMSFFLTLKPECSLSVTSVLLVFGVWICSRQLTLLSERFSGRRFASKRASLLRAKRIAIVLTSIMLLISGGILLSAPVYNAVFYVPCFLEALLLFAMIARSFRTQMELATRRPPQFNKKGGQDHA